MNVRIDSYGATDLGRRRDNNEDQFFIAEFSGSMTVHHTSVPLGDCATIFGRSQSHFFLVADGLGGHPAGARASALAISAVCAYAVNSLQWLLHDLDESDAPAQLQAIAAECQKRLSNSARAHPQEYGMATTLTLAIVAWPHLYVLHVGDSRCYLFRNGQLAQLTRDHTLSQLYADRGTDDRDCRGAQHALWNVVSSEGGAAPIADVVRRELSVDDQIILCTDGLHGYVAEQALIDVVSRHDSAREACERLVALANENGGQDNITVVVARFRSAGPSRDDEALVESRIPLEHALDHEREQHDTDEFDLAELDAERVDEAS